MERLQHWLYSTFHREVERGVYPLDWAGGPESEWRGVNESELLTAAQLDAFLMQDIAQAKEKPRL